MILALRRGKTWPHRGQLKKSDQCAQRLRRWRCNWLSDAASTSMEQARVAGACLWVALQRMRFGRDSFAINSISEIALVGLTVDRCIYKRRLQLSLSFRLLQVRGI
jgi:hypothetical protein